MWGGPHDQVNRSSGAVRCGCRGLRRLKVVQMWNVGMIAYLTPPSSTLLEGPFLCLWCPLDAASLGPSWVSNCVAIQTDDAAAVGAGTRTTGCGSKYRAGELSRPCRKKKAPKSKPATKNGIE